MIRGTTRVEVRILAVAATALTILAAGCGPTPSPVRPSASPAAPTGSLAPAATAERTSPSVAVEVDKALLAVVPSAVAGIAVTFDAETSASLAADPAVAADAASLAVALAIVPGSSAAEGGHRHDDADALDAGVVCPDSSAARPDEHRCPPELRLGVAGHPPGLPAGALVVGVSPVAKPGIVPRRVA